MNLQASAITRSQWQKVLKAILYSFLSAAIGAVVLLNGEFSKKALLAVLVAGVNGALVAVKQVFSQE